MVGTKLLGDDFDGMPSQVGKQETAHPQVAGLAGSSDETLNWSDGEKQGGGIGQAVNESAGDTSVLQQWMIGDAGVGGKQTPRDTRFVFGKFVLKAAPKEQEAFLWVVGAHEALRGSSIGQQQMQLCQICWQHQSMLLLERLLLGHRATHATPFA